MGDRVGAQLGLRRVGRPAGQGHLDQGVAAQALGEGQPGRLTHDGDVGSDPQARQGGEHGLGTEAGVLLVGDEGEDDAARHPEPGEPLGSDDHRRDTALHVARPATRHPAPSTAGSNGAGIPSTPTVSRWPVSTTVGPVGPLGPTATRLGRSGWPAG